MLGHRKTDRLNWFLRELGGGGGATTIRALGMMGAQFSPINDYAVDAPFVDLMKRARTLSKAVSGNDGIGQIRVLSLTRASNVVTAVLADAPGQNAGDFTMATGMKVVLTCLSDPTFSTDHATITVASQTQFTYANTGANGTAKISVTHDCPGAILGHCSLGANGHPNEDFFARLCGSPPPGTWENADLVGTYLGTFPGGLPTNLSAGGATLSNYTPGGSTFTLTITADDTTEANATSLTFTGVPTDGSFQLPRIIRNDHDQTGATLLRPDFKTHMQRFAVHRNMDWAKTNFNPSHVGWTDRPLINLGTGLPLSMMIEASNEAAADAAWFNVPTLASDAYIQGMAEQIRDDLDAGIDAYFEFSNEPWNDQFTQYFWVLAMMRAETQALLHGYQGVNDITSIVCASNVVTVTTTRPHGYTTGAGDVVMDSDTSFNATGVTFTVTGASTFTYPLTRANGSFTLGTGKIYRNLSSSLLATGVRDVYQLRDLMVAKRVYEISQIVSTAFGGLGTRAHMVYMGHIANFTGEFGMFQETTLPWLTTTYGAVSGYLTAIGGAPYAVGADNSAAVACAEMIADADAHMPFMHNMRFLAQKYGLQVWHYEISPDQQGQSDGTKVDAVYAHADFQTANAHVLNVAYGMGADKVVVYTAGGRAPGSGGAGSWGSYQNMTECLPVGSATAKKQAGIDDVLLAAPPANIEPNAVPGTALLAGSGIDGTDATLSIPGAFNGCRYFNSSSAYIEKLIYVAATGTYDLTLWGGGHQGGGSSNFSLRVYVDDVLAGSLAMKSYPGDIGTWPSGGEASPTTLSVSLTAGWRILKLLAPSGAQPDRVAVSKAVFA